MKVNFKHTSSEFYSTVDLEEAGYDEDTTWDDLTEEQQYEIIGNATEQMYISTQVESYDKAEVE